MALMIGLLAFPALSWAGDISGVVIDTNTGSFLRGADVHIDELGRATSTGRSGDFRFVNVPGGVYTVVVNYIGYQSTTQTVQVPEVGTVNPRIAIGSEVVELEEFRIEGYREGKSLALQQKKTANNIRDILSADSVGQLPDRNVADALVRLPGVAVDMSNGEGRFVSIRGIAPDLNNVTVNGATVANPGIDGRNGRAMPLDVIGSSQISQLEVIKAVTPDMDAQGLGGTVEIKTASAFDKEGGYFNGSMEVGYADQPEKSSHRGEIAWTHLFGPDKKLGVALSATYEWRPYETEAVDLRWDQGDFLADFDNDGVFEDEVEDYAYISAMEIVPEEGNRQRIGLNTKIEWKPNEDTELYLNGIWNQFTDWEIGNQDVLEGDRLDYDDDQDFLEDGGSRADRLEPFLTSPDLLWFPSTGNLDRRKGIDKRRQTLINTTVGGKKRWGNLTLNPEFTYSYAKEKVLNEGHIQFRSRLFEGGMAMRDGDAPITTHSGIEFPFFIDPEGDGLRYQPGNSRLDGLNDVPGADAIPVLFDNSGPYPVITVPDGALTDGSRLVHHRNRIEDSIVEEKTYIPKFDAQWDSDNFLGTGNSGFLKAGVKYFNRNRVIDDNSYRPIFCAEGVDLQDCLNAGEVLFDDGNPNRPSAAEFPNLIVPGRTMLGFYNPGIELAFREPWQQSMGGSNPASGNTLFPFAVDDVESSENNIEDDYDLDEKILSLYGMFSVDIGEKFTVLGGVRYEKTDVEVIANQWTRFDDFEGNIGAVCDTFNEDAGSTFCLETSNSTFNYKDVFPNVQAIFRITDKLQLRAAFTTTTGRPNFEDAAPITRMETELRDARVYANNDPDDELLNVAELRLRARIRNPDLKPYYSYNYDLSLEYYTDWGAAFSFAAFHKEVKDPIFSFETDDRFDVETDVNEPEFADNLTVAAATAIVEERCQCDVNTAFLDQDDAVERLRMEGWDNAEHGRVSGIELAAAMPFTFLPEPLDGFGVDANISFIDSEFDIFERRNLPEKTPFFQQPSKIANVSLWYQKGRFQGRVAMRYQDESFDEVDNPANSFYDRYDAPREQWDAQASYRLNDNWSVYFNVNNFTDQRDIRWFGNNASHPNTIEQFGSTWRFGVRWNY